MLARLRADLHVHTREAEPSIAYSARDHDVLLIPGVEATVEGRHVLVYNADVEADKLRTFADLRRYRTPEWLVAAPHPLFPASYCLRERLWQQIDLFDAIEFSHFYTPRIDFNRPAVKLAAAVGLPLLGTSDSHLDEQFGTTFSLIEADLSVESALAAVKHGRLSIVSRPLTLSRCLGIVARQALANARVAVRARLRPTSPAGETILTPR